MAFKEKLRSFMDVRGNRMRQEGARDHPLPSAARNALTVVVGEFCGTFMFLLLSFIGAQTALNTNSPGDPSAPLLPFSLMYIAASFGTALAVNVWIFFRVTGGMFNPAVTLGLALVGAVKPLRAIMVFVTQLVAAIAAAAVVDGLIPGPLTVANKLSNGTNIPQGLFLEMFLTSQLVLTVYFLAVEKHRATFLAPVGIGISVFIAHIAGTDYTGTSINPARSFGPAVISGFVGYHWIFWLGPFMGSGLAFAVYMLLKWLDYGTANPGQDADDVEKANRGVLHPTSSMNEKRPIPSDAGNSDQSPPREPSMSGTRKDNALSDRPVAPGGTGKNGAI
ncbi:Aquaporin-1 [Tolypocladium ophioglossoides CBS 100239]|uniref:Aquaporin-1 n=1 Tax=Tolypocladium ophioglossoides (strain CBS 100239) TaxID=1163406 RepID=A0A0L0N686_TOLOC|nr:Aquaporin-1 [Tolypocladium ophioglossoides CBS 100239]